MKDATTQALLEFLQSGARTLTITGLGTLSPEDAKKLLGERIPAEIQVRGNCSCVVRGVVAAPHAGFDHWSEYYCNRLAPALQLGWVVGLNFRDQDAHRLPVSIGRHVHVNRPTESAGPGSAEYRTERAEQVFLNYVQALQVASGSTEPLDLLIEIHSHKRSEDLEIATVGLDAEAARLIFNDYTAATSGHEFPELRIEPLHSLRLNAGGAKSCGVLQASFVRHGLHIEIPRGLRASEERRMAGVRLLIQMLEGYVKRLAQAW